SDAGLAHQARLPIDLRTARAALPRFAVPATGERAVVMRLNEEDGIQHDHAWERRHLVVRLGSTGRVPSEYPQSNSVHLFCLLEQPGELWGHLRHRARRDLHR